VSARDAAERYGLVIRNNRARCIWHSPDAHPSLSFRDSWCKCFACQAGGSSLDVAMRLFGGAALRPWRANLFAWRRAQLS